MMTRIQPCDVAIEPPPRPLIVLSGLGKTYTGPPPVTALRPTDLAIAAGGYVTVIGPSGSGKSTLLNLLGLLDRPSEGGYVLDGYDTTTLAERHRTALRATHIGFVFQAYHLLGHVTVVENVALSLLYRGVRARRRLAAARAALDRVGLADRADSLPGQLSGGQRQRVAIARALAGEPRLLLCDEPTGNLDSVSAESILSCLDELHADGLTVVLITHNLDAAARGARTLDIRDGVVRELTA